MVTRIVTPTARPKPKSTARPPLRLIDCALVGPNDVRRSQEDTISVLKFLVNEAIDGNVRDADLTFTDRNGKQHRYVTGGVMPKLHPHLGLVQHGRQQEHLDEE